MTLSANKISDESVGNDVGRVVEKGRTLWRDDSVVVVVDVVVVVEIGARKGC